jgi:hypothetical protein
MKEPLQPSQLYKGPIRHLVLSDEFIDRVKRFKVTLADVDETSLEETIDNFKRDTHPEEELAIWERIANTYRLFLSHNPKTDLTIKKEIFAVLLGASMGADDWSNIKKLNSDQINHLVLSYRGL